MSGEERAIKIKSEDSYGVLMIPSRVVERINLGNDMFEVKSLNNVMREDGTTVMLTDEDIGEI